MWTICHLQSVFNSRFLEMDAYLQICYYLQAIKVIDAAINMKYPIWLLSLVKFKHTVYIM